LKRFLPYRIASLTVLVITVMTSSVEAQQPTVVLSIRSIDALLDDAEFVGQELGKPGSKAMADQLLGNVTQGKGLAGIDKKKPLGLFWNAVKSGPPEMPVAFLPVSDAKALQDLLKQFAPDLTETNGIWSASINGTKVMGKMSGGYLFVGLNLPPKLPDSAKILNLKYDLAVDISVAGIPDEAKQFFLSQVEEGGRRSQEAQAPPRNEGEKQGRELGFNATLAALKAIVNETDRLTIGLDVDQKTRIGAVDISVTAKTNTAMANVLAAYGKVQPLFADLGSDSSMLRVVLSHPTPFGPQQVDVYTEMAKTAMAEIIDKDNRVEKETEKAAYKAIANRIIGIIQSTARAGTLHAGLAIEPGTNKKARLIAGVKVANGNEAAKLVDDLVQMSKSSSDAAKVKVDAAKHSGARIHSITPDPSPEFNQVFGTEPIHLGFRTDSLWVSLGGDNLNALKKALDAKLSPRVSRPPISIQAKPAALIVFMPEENAALTERAKKVATKTGDKAKLEVTPISNGAKFRLELGTDLLGLVDLN
jgi:hypothetical protein